MGKKKTGGKSGKKTVMGLADFNDAMGAAPPEAFIPTHSSGEPTVGAFGQAGAAEGNWSRQSNREEDTRDSGPPMGRGDEDSDWRAERSVPSGERGRRGR
jgi:hypothetical protein